MKPFEYKNIFRMFLGTIFLGCWLVFLGGCGEKTSSLEMEPVAPVQDEQKEKPDHFILCIDNSRSIRGQEQVIIRETAMLLADLAEIGDRISVITFGQDARVALQGTMSRDQDRIRFKEQISSIDFSENFSDIRAGLRVAAENIAELAGGVEYEHHCIVLSDGKLEPADKKTLDAFNDMLRLLNGQLAEINRYAVVLGDTYSRDTIIKDVEGGPMTGERLMHEFVAVSQETFFHARQMDQLISITVDILNKTKGTSAIGQDTQTASFRIDNTVQSMTLVIRKRSMDGTRLFNPGDVRINQPEADVSNTTQEIYRSSDYTYFDLVVVRRPIEGIWSVTLENGQNPEVLSNIVTPVKLQYDIKKKYFSNESALGWVWLYDASVSKMINDPMIRIKARVSVKGDPETPPAYLDLHHDKQSGQFFLEIPGQVLDAFPDTQKDGDFGITFIAQRLKPDTTELDPWFVRQSPPLSVNLVASFMEWTSLPDPVIKWPFQKKQLTAGAVIESDNPAYPGCETPPRLQFILERYHPKENKFEIVHDVAMESQILENRALFEQSLLIENMEAGTYRYQYRLKDCIATGGGAFTMASPIYSFQVVSYGFDSWQFRTIAGILALAIIQILSAVTARMRGKIITDGKSKDINHKTYYSESQYKNRFKLKAKRILFIRSYILMKVITGFVTVKGEKVTAEQKIKLSSAQKHTIEHDEGSRKVVRQLMVNV
jgi:hypothetical protein